MNVGELIEKLSKFEDDRDVRMDDADGQRVDDVELEDGTVWIVGA